MPSADNGSDNGPEKKGWKPGKRDAFFLAFVSAVVILLAFGSGDRTTKPTPNDAVHQQAVTKAACLSCHNTEGVRPQPKRHINDDECFRCHLMPKDWKGPK